LPALSTEADHSWPDWQRQATWRAEARVTWRCLLVRLRVAERARASDRFAVRAARRCAGLHSQCPSGGVVGAINTYVDFIPADGGSNFMVESWSEKKPNVASSEAYYDGFLPPQE
jgi:hypothetical protein